MKNKIGVNKFYIGGITLLLLILSVSSVLAFWPFTGNFAFSGRVPNSGNQQSSSGISTLVGPEYECNTFTDDKLNFTKGAYDNCKDKGYKSLCFIEREYTRGYNLQSTYPSYDVSFQILTCGISLQPSSIRNIDSLICCRPKQ